MIFKDLEKNKAFEYYNFIVYAQLRPTKWRLIVPNNFLIVAVVDVTFVVVAFALLVPGTDTGAMILPKVTRFVWVSRDAAD